MSFVIRHSSFVTTNGQDNGQRHLTKDNGQDKGQSIWCVDVLKELNFMRLSPIMVAIAAIASFRQAMLTQMPATNAAPIISTPEKTLFWGQKDKKVKKQADRKDTHLVPLSLYPLTSQSLPSVQQKTKHTLISAEFLRRKTPTANNSLLKALQKPVKITRFMVSVPNQIAQPKTKASLLLTQSSPGEETPPSLQIPNNSDTSKPNPNTPNPTQPTESAPTRTPQTPPSVPQTPPTVPILPAPGTESLPQQNTPNRIQVPIDPAGKPAPGSFPNQPNQVTPPPAPSGTQPTPSTPAPSGTQPDATPEAAQSRVLVAEVAVSSETGELTPELQNQVYQAIRTQPGRTTTRSQLQQDINAVFATGFFANVRAVPEDTPLGVRVSFVVEPNPVLRQVQVQANVGTNVKSVLPPKVVEDIFRPQYGTILNLRRLQEGVKQLNAWYQKNGYVLAQVIDSPQVAPDGTVTLQVAEGVVEDVQVRFVREGQPTDDEGKPIKGRTRDFIVTRELELQPGGIFNRNVVQQDLQRVYGLGTFEDVNVSLNPGEDPRKVVVVVNVDERRSGSVNVGGGISSASGLFGAVSYQEQNLGGNNQKLGAELQVGTQRRDILFDVRFTDPWIAGDPYRTSYTINGFSRRSISLIFDGDNENIEVGEDGDRPRVLRLGGGINFTRPLSRDPLRRAEWTASAGLQYQQVTIKDADGDNAPRGRVNGREIDLTFSGEDSDDLLTLQGGLARDRRNNLLTPTSGSFLRFGVEQSIPVGSGNILLNRLRANYSQFIPVNFTNFNKGPETLAFNLQAGTVLGDLPPYEAFSLGGSNSVRGYGEGELGSGRSFVLATAEYRFPIFSIVGGAVFVDFGTDLGTDKNVPGNPGELLGKPGTGVGYGVGVRVNSPLGPLRLDYGFNDDGDGRLQFGIGEKF